MTIIKHTKDKTVQCSELQMWVAVSPQTIVYFSVAIGG